jgi:hypothetical protein
MKITTFVAIATATMILAGTNTAARSDDTTLAVPGRFEQHSVDRRQRHIRRRRLGGGA